MNDTKLNGPIYCNKKYTVFLDSDNKFTFKNKRIAQDFITHVQHMIDEATLFISEKLNILEEFYRLYYLADRDFKFKFAIANSISFINNRLEWFTSRRGSDNYDTILFTSLINCFDELYEGFQSMERKAAQRKDTITKRRCSLNMNIIRMYRDEFFRIGIKEKSLTKLKVKKAK
jgi:hypothetical protein